MRIKTTAIILSAGSGKRMNSNIAKQYLEIKDKPIIVYTIEKFLFQDIDEVIVVTKKDDLEFFEKLISGEQFKNIKLVIGGRERSESVFNALKDISEDTEIVIIHDGVRPFIKREVIKENINSAKKYGAVITAVKTKDTIKIVQDNKIKETPNRENLYMAQTPQTFRKDIIKRAYNEFKIDEKATDDSVLVENIGIDVHIVEGSYENIKITTKEDLIIAEAIINNEEGEIK